MRMFFGKTKVSRQDRESCSTKWIPGLEWCHRSLFGKGTRPFRSLGLESCQPTPGKTGRDARSSDQDGRVPRAFINRLNFADTTLVFVGFFMILALSIQAQEATESLAPEGNGAQPSAGEASQSSPSPQTSGPASALDYLFNRKPKDGTAAQEFMEANAHAKSKAMAEDALGGTRFEDPATRARFEKFLSLAPVAQSELDAYQQDYEAVLDLLRDNKTFDAWKKLFDLADYTYIDAGVSWELANRVESIWNADKTTLTLERKNRDLRNTAQNAIRNADMMSNEIRRDEIEYQRRLRNSGAKNDTDQKQTLPNGGAPMANEGAGGGPSMTPAVDGVMGKLELTEEYLRSLEAKARIKMNELKAEKLLDTARDNFSSYISTLYESGRYRHVLLAADFFRRIFDEGDYPVEIAQQVNAALEIDREVQGTVDVFQYKLEQGDVSSATDRLQEAFMLSEYHPAVLLLDRAQKGKVERFTGLLSRMQTMIEARDFASLESLLVDMKETAPDFDTTKPMAIVNAVKLESQLRLGKAKMAAQQGNLDQAMEEFEAAAQAWPGNPDLKDKALTFFDTQDIQTQSLGEFDRLVENNDYRAIFDKQLAFAPAMKDDEERQEQLKAALENYKLAETAIEKANLLRANGDVYGAWETVEFAVKDLPDDNKLNALRGDLAGKAADFVSAINKAQESESQKMLGHSLTWFAIAQRQYPASKIANEAIERLSGEIIEAQTL